MGGFTTSARRWKGSVRGSLNDLPYTAFLGATVSTSFWRRPQRKSRRVLVSVLPIELPYGIWQRCVMGHVPSTAPGSPLARLFTSPELARVCRKPRVRETAAVTAELLHHPALMHEVRCHCHPTKLTLELAELLVGVTVAGQSRKCFQVLTPPAYGRVNAQQCTFPGGFPDTRGHLAVFTGRAGPRSLSRGCGERVSELE